MTTPSGPESANRAIFILFLLAVIAQIVAVVFRLETLSRAPAFEMGFWLLAALTTLAGLACRLPIQNVIALSAIIAIFAFACEAFASRTSIPFGPRHFTDVLGDKPDDFVPWTIPLIWIVALVNARGIVRLILRPWRKTTYYGFWVIGWSALAVASFGLGLEPFAVHAKRYWFWGTTRVPFSYYGSALICFPSTAGVSTAILAFATPWFINKRPLKLPPDYHPLAVWLCLQFLFLSSQVESQRWLAALMTASVTITLAIMAVRGAKWTRTE